MKKLLSGIIALLLASQVWAAPTERQAVAAATSGGGSTHQDITLAATAASNLLVAFCFGRASFTGIADTGARTWTPYASITNYTNTNGPSFYSVWTAPTGAGGDTPTVTCTAGSSNWVQGAVVEVAAGNVSTTPFSTFAVESQGTVSTAVTIGPTGTSGANELAISFVGDDGGSTWTAPAGWATAVQQGSLTVGVSWLSVNSQTVTAAWTLSVQENSGGVIVVVKNPAPVVINGVLISNGHPVQSGTAVLYQ